MAFNRAIRDLNSRAANSFVLFSLLSVVICCAPVADAAPNTSTYFYFNEQIPLPLDHTRLAVHHGDEQAHAALAAQLHAAGLHIDTAAALSVADWHMIDVPEHMQHALSIRALVEELAAADGGAFVSPVFVDDLGGPLILTQDILVRFRQNVAPPIAAAMLAAKGFEVLEADWAGMHGAYRARSQSRNGFQVLERTNALAERPETIFAEPDALFTGEKGAAPPNDPLFSELWALHNTGQSLMCASGASGVAGVDVRALDAWQITSGDPGVIVVVIDDGVQLDHPDLFKVPFLGEDFTGQGGGGWPVNACDNHGTPVAGCIAALMNNNMGTVGVAPDVHLASARPFISNTNPCDGFWTSQPSWTVNALAWAEEIGARITNISAVFGFASAAIASKYAETRDNGMVHFAAAGNHSSPILAYPASLSSVNAVAAIDTDGELAFFSNWGPGLSFVAPGRYILTTDRTGPNGYTDNSFTCFGGTSAASPHAAGVAALVVSQNPSFKAFEVEEAMQFGATDLGSNGYNTTFGWGLVNAHGSLLASLSPTLVRVPDDFATIQQAINASPSGSKVAVSPGTYNEAIDFLGREIEVYSTHGPLSTIIDATGTGTSAVRFVSGESSAAVLNGFTIVGGAGSPDFPQPEQIVGGGVYVAGSNPTIRECIIQNNEAMLGGGMYVKQGAPTIIDSAVYDNVASIGGGGAWMNWDSQAEVSGSALCDNVPNNISGAWDEASDENETCADFLDELAGECFAPNFTPGCDGIGCSLQVYAIQPSCLTVSWDASCAALANELCAPYQHDNGVMDTLVSLPGLAQQGGAMAWMNHFHVLQGAQVITAIEIMWPSFTGGFHPVEGLPATLYVWSDPFQVGHPAAAEVLASKEVVFGPPTGEFETFEIDAVEIGPAGTSFFVGIVAEANGIVIPLAPFDWSVSAQRSWIVGKEGGGIDPNDLLEADFLTLIDEVCCPGNWLIRARTEPAKHGDLNGDGVVDVFDLIELINQWGPCADCAPGNCPADLTGDCVVDVFDLIELINNWG